MSVTRPDPEVQAGRALRRLRLSRGWSQEQVAIQMHDFGYEFHQTMIAKIEAAQRPLRVRELADFAALYGVEVQELIYPPNGSLAETDRDIAEVEARLVMIQQKAAATSEHLSRTRAALESAQAAQATCSRELAVLEERLSFLRKEREKLARWESEESDEELAVSDDFAFDLKPNPLTAGTAEEFIQALWQFRAWSGDPPWRSMAQRTGQAVAFSTMYNAMNSKALPKLDIVRAIIIGCGGSEDDLGRFTTAWRRIRSRNSSQSQIVELKSPSTG